jgi:pimeloyl-ACP methyl ester carboxylesterase
MTIVLLLLGALVGAWLLWRLFGPDLQPRYQGPQIRPIKVPGRTVFVDEREFFVREVGPEDAQPLVMAHGWSFDGEMNFFRLIPELSQRYRLIVPDHRNHGKSDRIRGAFDIEDLATALAGVLDELGYERIDLLGYSMGGMVAQVFARRYPERVDHLILAATAAYPIDRFRIGARVAFWLGRALARVSTKEAARFTYRFLTRNDVIDDSEERWMWAALLNRDPTLFYESGNAVWRFDARPWVGEISVPTMVIIPTKDEIVPVRTQRDLVARLNEPTVVEIEGAGHAAVLAQPEAYVKAIDAFLQP